MVSIIFQRSSFFVSLQHLLISLLPPLIHLRQLMHLLLQLSHLALLSKLVFILLTIYCMFVIIDWVIHFLRLFTMYYLLVILFLIPIKLLIFCFTCCLGKSHKLPFSASQTTYQDPLELVFSNVWGPAPGKTAEGFRYVHFTDVTTRFTWFYPLKNKSGTLAAFIHFKTHFELHTRYKIKNFQFDRGGELIALSCYLSSQGIHHHLSCPYTP